MEHLELKNHLKLATLGYLISYDFLKTLKDWISFVIYQNHYKSQLDFKVTFFHDQISYKILAIKWSHNFTGYFQMYWMASVTGDVTSEALLSSRVQFRVFTWVLTIIVREHKKPRNSSESRLQFGIIKSIRIMSTLPGKLVQNPNESFSMTRTYSQVQIFPNRPGRQLIRFRGTHHWLNVWLVFIGT